MVWPGLFLSLQTTPGPNQDTGTHELCVCPPQLGHMAFYGLSCAINLSHKTHSGGREGVNRYSCHSLSFLGHAHHLNISQRKQPLGRHPMTGKAGTAHVLLTKPQLLPSASQHFPAAHRSLETSINRNAGITQLPRACVGQKWQSEL